MKNLIENGSLLPMTVTEGVTVNVLPNEQHEYLMTRAEVANGYGASKHSILQALHNHPEELVEGKHFIKGGNILLPPSVKGLIQPNSILFTKRGIVRLGFFIKSERAKVFRDWAEDLIIKVDEHVQQKKNNFQSEYSQLLELVDAAAIVLGSQNRLASRLCVSAATFSHMRNMPWLVSDTRKKHIAYFCQKIIAEGANYIPESLQQSKPKAGTSIDTVGILKDICCVDDAEIRLSLLEKLTEAGVL